MQRFKSLPGYVKCPHCNKEIDVSVFTRSASESNTNRSASEVRQGQLDREAADRTAAGFPTTTMADLQAQAARRR